MENKGEKEDLREILLDSEIRDIAVKHLTKKGLVNFDKQINEQLLESFKKPTKKTEEELIEYLAKQKTIKFKKKSSDYDFYRFLSWQMFYISFFDDIKKRRGLEKAKKALVDLARKRFKSPKNIEEFIKQINLLQEKYPKILTNKQDRNRIRKQLKDVPIYITHELAKTVFNISNPTKKDFANIRKKTERAKKEGFL